MANPLKEAHAAAAWSTAQMGKLFARAGNSAHPRGRIMSAYREGLRSLNQALRDGGSARAQESLGLLRARVESESLALLRASIELGKQTYSRQAQAYGLTPVQSPLYNPVTALDAVMAVVDAQVATATAMLSSGVDTVLVTGDEERAGIVRAGPVLSSLAMWMMETAMAILLFSGGEHGKRGGPAFEKQVVAALDAKTTQCCLLAHGQIQPLEGKFVLRGTPRYADEMDHTPFHGWCRSSIALYLPGFDDGLTQNMLDGARQIIAERAAGGSGERTPADAFA